MEFTKLAKQLQATNVKKGFWSEGEKKNIGELLMLCVSELGEALDADRNGKRADMKAFELALENGLSYEDAFKTYIKDTFEDELADAVYRIMSMSVGLGIDLENHILLKHEYNKSRPFKHGKNY